MRIPAVVIAVLALMLSGCGLQKPGGSPTVAPTSPPVVASPTDSAPPTPTGPSESPQPTTSVTPTEPEGANLILRGGGVSTFNFGAKQAAVSELLTDQLGEPDEKWSGVLCEFDSGSPWAETYNYGGLWVRFVAKDKKKSSPRFLDGWGFQVSQQLFSPLQIEDDVPLNLSMKQLQAAFPGSKLKKTGLGDGTYFLTLPNKIVVYGDKNPIMIQAGKVSLCE